MGNGVRLQRLSRQFGVAGFALTTTECSDGLARVFLSLVRQLLIRVGCLRARLHLPILDLSREEQSKDNRANHHEYDDQRDHRDQPYIRLAKQLNGRRLRHEEDDCLNQHSPETE